VLGCLRVSGKGRATVGNRNGARLLTDLWLMLGLAGPRLEPYLQRADLRRAFSTTESPVTVYEPKASTPEPRSPVLLRLTAQVVAPNSDTHMVATKIARRRPGSGRYSAIQSSSKLWVDK